MDIDVLFFELLQVAIGNRKCLSKCPSVDEWNELFALSKKQALTAIAFVGLSKYLDSLGEDSPYVSGVRGSMVYLQWLGLTAKIAQRNDVLNKQCKELCDTLNHDGFQSVILKGQANHDLYPEDLREARTPGDLDVWVRPMGPIAIAVSSDGGKGAEYVEYKGKEAVIRYVMMNTPEGQHKTVVNDMRQHHIDYHFFNDTSVEVHFTPSYFNNPRMNHRLQRWFMMHEDDYCKSSLGFNVGSTGFNTVYQLIHIYRHLFSEGIGLRQLLDYYFVLRALHIEQGELADRGQSMGMWAESIGRSVPSNTEIMHTVEHFGMKRFAGAVMWVLAQVFDPRDDVKTKTIKTPDGSASVTLSENSNELDVSATASSTDRDTVQIQPSGNKQGINQDPSQPSLKGQELDWQQRWPWMICEPNEEAGRFLLEEIMMAGNFGKYDERNRQMQGASKWKRFFLLSKRNWRFFKQYPSEVLWDPWRRGYNVVWRKLELWR